MAADARPPRRLYVRRSRLGVTTSSDGASRHPKASSPGAARCLPVLDELGVVDQVLAAASG
jgi:hypothetical protein